MADTVHIALSPWNLTDAYNRHTATTLVSILENCSQQVTAHLLHEGRLSVDKPDETQDTMEKYRILGDAYHADIRFHDIVLPDWVNDAGRKNLRQFTPGSLLRLYLPDILPDTIEKIVYFDSDMIVLTDIADVWNIDMNEYSFGAVLEANRSSSIGYYGNHVNRHGIDTRHYINSGLLVMNLQRLRKHGSLSDQVMGLIQDNPEFSYPDQDALNLLFQEKEMLFLDEKYNIPVGLRMTNFCQKRRMGISGSRYSDCILHFNGTKKPWKIYSGPVDEYYWQYLRKTPWGEDPASVDEMYAEVRGVRKSLLDAVMSTPLNKYLRIAESIMKRT